MPSLHAATAPLAPASKAPGRPRQQAANGLGKAPYRAVVVAILLTHVGALWVVLQVPAVRAAAVEAAPLFVDLLTPPAPPPISPPPLAQPLLKTPPPTLVTTPAALAPAPFEAPPVLEVPPTPAAPLAVESPPAPPAVAPPPKDIPASAVQYLVKPEPDYPRTSVRLGETGQVMVRVLIDEAGLPREVRVEQSSGHARLDEAAVAAVRKARFKPPTLNGTPIAGWARIPIPFELEQ